MPNSTSCPTLSSAIGGKARHQAHVTALIRNPTTYQAYND
jgi:hypothetical protein